MPPSTKTEVCVLGGGPAGATAARRLAELGHGVCLVERTEVSRSRPGEFLSAGILPLLDSLDLQPLLAEAGFFRPRRSLVLWADTTPRVREEPGEPGFLVDRGRFDKILLATAQQAGAQVLRPALAKVPERLDTGGWRVPVELGGERIEIEAAFLVDATGRRCRLPGLRRRSSVPTLSLCGYWRGVPGGDPEPRIEAGEDEWFWGAPLPDGTFSAMVFLDPKRCVWERREGIVRLYHSLIARSSLLRDVLRGEPVGCAAPCDASPSATETPAGADWIKVGEAAFSLDPLSSQGVQAAVASALRGAVVAHTLLSAPANSRAAIDFHRARQEETVERNQAWAALHYAERHAWSPGDFWRRRSITTNALPSVSGLLTNPQPPPRGDQRVGLSEAARLVPTPSIRGDLVVSIPALHHPALPRPVAFLDGIELASLLDQVTGAETIDQVLQGWSIDLPPAAGVRILHWLWDRSILMHV